MKLVVPVRLYPGAAQEAALRDTLALCNKAADLVSAQASGMRVTSKRSLQRLVYGDLKAMGLSAQPAIQVARKVSGAYAALRANIRAGNLGDPGSRRRVKAESKPITFRADAAQPYDDRCLSWQPGRRTVSIWTTAGRLAGIPFRCSPAQLARLRDHRQGEPDLVHRDGKWFLYATCEVPEPDLTGPAGFPGVYPGIANIATTRRDPALRDVPEPAAAPRAAPARQAPVEGNQVRDTAAEEAGAEGIPVRRRHQSCHR